tara:strand:- start:558 stop:863 length:306 start_codon:yes stop_codon:yes gene_type:complete
MRLKSLDWCRFKIGKYPSLAYNATGIRGKATLVPNEKIISKMEASPYGIFNSSSYFKNTKIYISLYLPVLKSKCQWIRYKELLIIIPEKSHRNSNQILSYA